MQLFYPCVCCSNAAGLGEGQQSGEPLSFKSLAPQGSPVTVSQTSLAMQGGHHCLMHLLSAGLLGFV